MNLKTIEKAPLARNMSKHYTYVHIFTSLIIDLFSQVVGIFSHFRHIDLIQM